MAQPNADFERLRAILAAEIIGVLDRRGLSVRKAGELTGIAAADFCRLRCAKLGRFTIDRLMTILDQEVEVTVNVRPRPEGGERSSRAPRTHDRGRGFVRAVSGVGRDGGM